MKLLEGKTALIFGIANNRSIAYGIAEEFHKHGATIVATLNDMLRISRQNKSGLSGHFILPCRNEFG